MADCGGGMSVCCTVGPIVQSAATSETVKFFWSQAHV